MATNVKSSTKDVYVNQMFNNPRKAKVRFFTWDEIDATGDYLLSDVPVKSIVLACYVVVTTAFTSGGSATVTGGVLNGTTDDVDLFWNTTTGAVANFAIRSIVGAFSPRDFSTTDATDFEVKLDYDTLARDISLSTATAALTAGEGYLVVEYMELVAKAQ